MVQSGLPSKALNKIRAIWDETMRGMGSKEVAFIWSEADREHRMGEGIRSNFEGVQTHFHQSLKPDLFSPPLSNNMEKFWNDYKKEYPGTKKVYLDILLQSAEDRSDADTWNISDPFVFGGESKFYQTSNHFDIDALTKDLDRLVLLKKNQVCDDVAMMVANTGLNNDDLQDVSGILDRYRKTGLEILRYGC